MTDKEPESAMSASANAWLKRLWPFYCLLVVLATVGYAKLDPYQIDGDAVAYMDIGDNILAHQWAGVVDGYWHPLYPAVLMTAKAIFHADRWTELAAYYKVNFGIFLLEMLAVVLFADALTKLRDAREQNGGGFLLGRYGAPCGGFLVVDLREKNSDSILSQAVVNYPSISPVLARVYTADEFNLFFKKLGQSHDLLRRDTPLAPTLLRFKPIENNLIFYLTGNITHKEQLEYQVIKGGEVYIDWRPNDFDKPFIWLRNLPPGDYELKMRYPIQRSHVTSYPFRIAAAWHQTSLFWIVLGSLAASFFASILLLVRTRNQRRSLARERLKKETMETELRALRSQLNPHFVFNSLNSIQGLINKSDEDGANRYLTSFATLMRDVLNGAARENNPLHQEIRILEHYLRLEQLRCDFAYTVETDPQINSFEVEIPSLLIQPLVENSVKHAMAHLDGKGRIGIRFTRRDNDLVAAIEDNGKGFDPEKNNNGFGLGLTRKRVSLVNELSAGRTVRLEIDSEQGTSIRIFFNNWLT